MQALPGDTTGLSARDTEGDRYVRFCEANFGADRAVWPHHSSVRQQTGGYTYGIPLPTPNEVKASVEAQLGALSVAGAAPAAGGSGAPAGGVAQRTHDAVVAERDAARATLQAIADRIGGGPGTGNVRTVQNDVDDLIVEWGDFFALLQRISGAVQSTFDLTTLGDDVDALAGENTQLRARVAALSPQRPSGALPDVAQLQSDLAAAQADIQLKVRTIFQLQQDLQTAQQDLTDLQNEMHAVHAKTPGATKFTRWLPGVTTELDAAADRHGDLVAAVGGLYAHLSLTTASSAPGQVRAIEQAYDQQMQEAQAVLRKFLAPGDAVPDSMDRVLAELEQQVDQSLQELDALKQQPVGGPSVVSPSASSGAQAPLQQELQQKQQELDALKASMGTSLAKVTRMLHGLQDGNGKARTATDVANLDAALDALGREARELHQHLLARAGMNAPTEEGALMGALASMATSRGALVQKINERYNTLQGTQGVEEPEGRLDEMLHRMFAQENSLGTLQAKVLLLLWASNGGAQTEDMDADLAEAVRLTAQSRNVSLNEESETILRLLTFPDSAPPSGGGSSPLSSPRSSVSGSDAGSSPSSPGSSRSPSPASSDDGGGGSAPGSPRQPGVQDGEQGIFGFAWEEDVSVWGERDDGLVQPGPDSYIAEVAETEEEIERKYKTQVVVFTEKDVPDETNRRYPNFPQWEEGDVDAGGDVERQGLLTRQDALRDLVALIQEMGGPVEGNVFTYDEHATNEGMYKAMFDTENSWEQRGALFWAKYRPDPDLDFLWAHRAKLAGYGGAGVPMWLLLPEELCTPRMWEARQGFLEFVQAKKDYYQQEPVEEGKTRVAFEGEKEAWANRALPVENPLKSLPREPRRRRGR